MGTDVNRAADDAATDEEIDDRILADLERAKAFDDGMRSLRELQQRREYYASALHKLAGDKSGLEGEIREFDEQAAMARTAVRSLTAYRDELLAQGHETRKSLEVIVAGMNRVRTVLGVPPIDINVWLDELRAQLVDAAPPPELDRWFANLQADREKGERDGASTGMAGGGE